MTASRRSRWVAAAAAVLALGALAAGADPRIGGGAEFRISNAGADGDPARRGVDPYVAFNSTAQEYLVVWAADGLATDDELEIFGQRVSASGAELGSDFRISNVGADGDDARNGILPSVAYNRRANEYLVVWEADALDGAASDEYFEIFGQRLSATGTEVGGEFRISQTGNGPQDGRHAGGASVAYNSAANEYLLAWSADGLATDNEFEIFGQRLSAGGAELGSDFRISTAGTDADVNREALGTDAVYNRVENEYLVTWSADGLPTDGKFEIFGQRLSAGGGELGPDFRISQTGADADAARDAFGPSAAYSPVAEEYLVTWDADGLATDDESEVFGQRLGGTGTELGSDFRVSNVGQDGDADRGAFGASVAYDSIADEYLVAWIGNGLAVDDEFEIFGQRLSTAGSELGSDFQISRAGADGDPTREAADPSIAFNPSTDEYLVAWEADGLLTNNEFEVFGRLLGVPAVPPPGIAPVAPGPRCKAGFQLKKVKTKSGKRKRRCVPKRKPK